MSKCSAAFLIVPLLLLGACGSEASKAGRYTLVTGSTLSVGVDVEGNVDIEVTIPQGSTGAGTYTSHDPDLRDDATFAKNILNDADTTVTVEVDDKGEIVAISTSVQVR